MTAIVEGVCCAYCTNRDTEQCPVINANNWSRWKNFCSEYEPDACIVEAKVLEMKGVEK